MTAGQYPTIRRGIGNLSPDLWERLMGMLREYEKHNRDETSAGKKGGGVKPFLASLQKAKCIAPNRYIYSWEEVFIKDDNSIATLTGGRTSTGDADEYDYAALNLIEIGNTSTYTAAGVNMSLSYPSGWTMQAFGGGSCSGTGCIVTLDGNPVVFMNKVSGKRTQTVARFMFSAVNEHDGICASTAIAVSDPILVVPTIPDGADYGYIYINSLGVPAFKDKDDNIVTFDVTS